MKEIKYGDIEYFTLIDLGGKLSSKCYDHLDLKHLDELRLELMIRIQEIEAVHKHKEI